MLVLFGARETSFFREMAALYSDHYRQVPLYTCADMSKVCTYVSVHNVVQCACWLSWTDLVLEQESGVSN